MHVISRKPFNEAIKRFPNCAIALAHLLRSLEKERFNSPNEMIKVIKSLDNFRYRDKWWVINVSGNKLRLITYINFEVQKVFVKHIVTHAEYEQLTKYYRETKK